MLRVHVPLREETVHLVGEREIRAMKRGSIVNTARVKVVDEEAMIRALEDGHVGPCPARRKSKLDMLSAELPPRW